MHRANGVGGEGFRRARTTVSWATAVVSGSANLAAAAAAAAAKRFIACGAIADRSEDAE